MHNRLTKVLALLPLLLLLGVSPARSAIAAAQAAGVAGAQAGERCFPETGQCISGQIRTFWEQNGGLAVFGLPLGPQQALNAEGGAVQVQWFERHRLELHPENPAPYNVLLGRLGADRLAQQGRDWQSFPRLDPNNADAARCRLFSETGQQVCDEFLQAFRSNGLSFATTPGISFEESLALFGLPLSGPMTEMIDGKEYRVQWFERARFELHPENQPPFNVLFGRLGAELGGGQGGAPATPLEGTEWRLVSYGPLAAPTPAVAEPAATLRFDGALLVGTTGCNSFRGEYTLTGDMITVKPLASTLVLCTDAALQRQELALLQTLQSELRYSITGDELRITYDGGRQALTLRAAPAPRLEGREWRLVSYGPDDPKNLAVEPGATITFDGARVSGSTGCNRFSGDYTAAGATISFGPLVATAAACTEDALAAQERAILGALQGEVGYTIVDGELRITYDEGRQTLTYR